MSLQHRRVLIVVLTLEFALGAVAIGWRLTRPAFPEANLDRLPVSTAADIRRLQQQVRTDRPAAWTKLGQAYLAYGYFPQAEACLKRAATLSPRDFVAVYGQAYSLDRMGKLTEAEARFRDAAELTRDEQAANCWYHIGICRLRRDDPQQAERAFLRAEDRYAPAVHARAKLLIRAGNSSEALELIDVLRIHVPLDIQTEMLAVQAWRELGDAAELSRAAERAERSQLQLQLTDHWEFLYPIRSQYGLMAELAHGRALAEQGQLSEAARLHATLLAKERPDDTEEMLERAAHLHLRAGQVNEAIEILLRLQKRMSLPPSAMHLLGDLLNSTQRIEDAIAMWESANRLRPDSRSYRLLSAAHRQMKDESQAERNLGHAALASGMDAYRANQLPVALEELQNARQILTDDARPLFYLGETYRALGENDKARAAFEECLKLDPDHGRALERLAH
jgi:tetratricopeptide (TPR) repeat protein